jgi:hypothetical protein
VLGRAAGGRTPQSTCAFRAGRVVDINALRALAPLSLRPRSQAARPPGPHAAVPLEPQAQEGYHATFAGVRVSGAEGLRREIQRRDRDAG